PPPCLPPVQPPHTCSALFPYTTLFRSKASVTANLVHDFHEAGLVTLGYSATPEFAQKNITEAKIHGPTRNPWNTNYSPGGSSGGDRKSTRLNSSHVSISYAVFCLKKKT